jgi:hypothetical protein
MLADNREYNLGNEFIHYVSNSMETNPLGRAIKRLVQPSNILARLDDSFKFNLIGGITLLAIGYNMSKFMHDSVVYDASPGGMAVFVAGTMASTGMGLVLSGRAVDIIWKQRS